MQPGGDPPSIFASPAPSMYSVRGPSHSATILNTNLTYMGRDDSANAMDYHAHSQPHNIASIVDGMPSPVSRQNSLGRSNNYIPTVQQHHQQQLQQHEQSQPTYFPPYFPVFDYGPTATTSQPTNDIAYSPLRMQAQQDRGSTNSMGGQLPSFEFATQPAFNNSELERFAGVPNGHVAGQGKGALGPDANMHTSWMDFVQQLM